VAFIKNRPITLARRPLPAPAELGDNYAFSVEVFLRKTSTSNRVFVGENNKQPLMPCHPARSRKLLKNGKAAVYRRYPFTIIMKCRVGGDLQPIEIKFDPGSCTTGIALVGHFERGERGYFCLQPKPSWTSNKKKTRFKTGGTSFSKK
jgi:hypothetical protein